MSRLAAQSPRWPFHGRCVRLSLGVTLVSQRDFGNSDCGRTGTFTLIVQDAFAAVGLIDGAPDLRVDRVPVFQKSTIRSSWVSSKRRNTSSTLLEPDA